MRAAIPLFRFIFFFILKHLTYLTTAYSTLSSIIIEKEEFWLFLLATESEMKIDLPLFTIWRCDAVAPLTAQINFVYT